MLLANFSKLSKKLNLNPAPNIKGCLHIVAAQFVQASATDNSKYSNSGTSIKPFSEAFWYIQKCLMNFSYPFHFKFIIFQGFSKFEGYH